MERIQKILANAGLGSRRICEELIKLEKVKVNGKIAKLGESAGNRDIIEVNGKRISAEKKIYVMLNKPKGYVTTVKEEHGMKTVLDLVKVDERVYPVGRLDKNSEGLLLMTNDGELANKLTHPRYGAEKEYRVILDKPLLQEYGAKLRKGTMVDDKIAKISRLVIKGNEVTLKIHEGRKHIVRRIFKEYGFEVKKLTRTRMGPLELGNLKPGKWRFLSEKEVKASKAF